MRTQIIAILLLLGTSVAWSGADPLTTAEAVRHRGERVTVAGIVSGLSGLPDATVVRIGQNPSLPVIVPHAAASALGAVPGRLVGQAVEVTGTISGARAPFSLRIVHAGQLRATPRTDRAAALRQRVAMLEHHLERATARVVAEARTAETVGSTRRRPSPGIPPAATQTTVLAYRGVPTRVEWRAGHRVLHYGRERWAFDDDGQLVDVRRN